MGVNLLEKLSDIRAKNAQSSNTEVLEGFKALMNQPNEGERILRNLFKSEGGEEQLGRPGPTTRRSCSSDWMSASPNSKAHVVA